jgi:hypothetical protein
MRVLLKKIPVGEMKLAFHDPSPTEQEPNRDRTKAEQNEADFFL